MGALQAIPTLADLTVARLELWMLVLIRISFMVFLLPLLGTEEVPARLKATLSFFLSLIIFPVIPSVAVEIPNSATAYILLAVREIYVGAIMGFAATFVFAGLRVAGSFLDLETGFSMVQLLDPTAQEESSAMGQLLVILFSILFLVSGGHLFYIRIIAESFQAIPLTTADFAIEGSVGILVRLSADALIFGLKAAAPVLATLFVSSIGLAVVARIMPQMNIWMVGMPLKLALGIMGLSITLPLIWSAFSKEQDRIQSYCLALLRQLGGS